MKVRAECARYDVRRVRGLVTEDFLSTGGGYTAMGSAAALLLFFFFFFALPGSLGGDGGRWKMGKVDWGIRV